jgi:hypothetical protein
LPRKIACGLETANSKFPAAKLKMVKDHADLLFAVSVKVAAPRHCGVTD